MPQRQAGSLAGDREACCADSRPQNQAWPCSRRQLVSEALAHAWGTLSPEATLQDQIIGSLNYLDRLMFELGFKRHNQPTRQSELSSASRERGLPHRAAAPRPAPHADGDPLPGKVPSLGMA